MNTLCCSVDANLNCKIQQIKPQRLKMGVNVVCNNFAETEKTCDEKGSPRILAQSLFPSENSMFQIFFLAQDQSQSVEVVETGEIDFGEIIQRLQMGESVFIKHKNPETYELSQKITEEEINSWYFTHC